ncbi:hypothetical protein AVEN_176610-1 [Araneus ventricosus]|uniref:Uncharacterized protein n=1 Tax=Araneus ventricosus TaxID=182803 RepID=A0A4Y2EG41_ARAVE|nr:hypothetical protein AVEN_176610-1 [Araneus ventricosus]
MLPSRRRQLENVKGGCLKLKKERSRRLSNLATVPDRRAEETEDKEIADCQTWVQRGRREEPKKQKNKEIVIGSNGTNCGSERRHEEAEGTKK